MADTQAKGKRVLPLAFQEVAQHRITKELNRFAAYNARREGKELEPVPLDVEISIYYNKRSIKANNLMWALYDIIADVLGAEDKSIEKRDAEWYYRRDMEEWAPEIKMLCPYEDHITYRTALMQSFGYITNEEKINDRNGKPWMRFTTRRTTSFWTTLEMSEHIKRLLQSLKDMGVTVETDGDAGFWFPKVLEWLETAESMKETGIEGAAAHYDSEPEEKIDRGSMPEDQFF
jgi:hypothetical protein